MKGEQNSEQLLSDTKVVELSERITSLETVAEEPERIGAAYTLGRVAQAGSVAALDALSTAMRLHVERQNRAVPVCALIADRLIECAGEDQVVNGAVNGREAAGPPVDKPDAHLPFRSASMLRMASSA